jgi:hypothetical protein
MLTMTEQLQMNDGDIWCIYIKKKLEQYRLGTVNIQWKTPSNSVPGTNDFYRFTNFNVGNLFFL